MSGARDGQLRINRQSDNPPWALQMYDDELNLWLTLAQADVEEDAMRAGIPILRGPYTVDFGDILHDGDTKTLWIPAIGDVLLRLFVDWQTVVQWDTGDLYIGQNLIADSHANVLALGGIGSIGRGVGTGLDSVGDPLNGNSYDASSGNVSATARVLGTTDPIQIMLYNPGGAPNPTMGHVEVYTLVARAVAP